MANTTQEVPLTRRQESSAPMYQGGTYGARMEIQNRGMAATSVTVQFVAGVSGGAQTVYEPFEIPLTGLQRKEILTNVTIPRGDGQAYVTATIVDKGNGESYSTMSTGGRERSKGRTTYWEVLIVQAATACELPCTLNHIELRTVRRQVFDHEILRMFLAPRTMKLGMVVAGIVQNDDYSSSQSGADATNMLEKLEEGFPIEGFILSPKRKLPVTQTHSSEIPRALPRGMMKENGVFHLGRNPHATGGAVELEVHLVAHPYVDIPI